MLATYSHENFVFISVRFVHTDIVMKGKPRRLKVISNSHVQNVLKLIIGMCKCLISALTQIENVLVSVERIFFFCNSIVIVILKSHFTVLTWIKISNPVVFLKPSSISSSLFFNGVIKRAKNTPLQKFLD